MVSVVIVDGFIDEPACLGVPPYLSPQVRAVAGAAKDAGAEVVYLTIEQLRKGCEIPHADISVLMAGSAVPGKYLRALPASGKEVQQLSGILPGIRVLGGPATLESAFREGEMFDVLARRDPAVVVSDILNDRQPSHRWRGLEEWNRWMLTGADIAPKHPDFPQPLIAEVETYRGCVRYASGGCSFCVEPMKGAPVFREPADILAEVHKLYELGVRNFRLGAQTCIVSYKADLRAGDPPRPNPEAIEELFAGIASLGVDVLHVDNANPAVIATYPEESRRILRSLVRHCTSGNVLALGMESADPRVVEANNLNSTPEMVMDAIRLINDEGRERGESGLPKLLPGLNFIIGLDGENERTLDLNLGFMRNVVDEGYLLRRLNIRQVIPLRREFHPTIGHSKFIRFKEQVREEIDRPMLHKLVPQGTVLRRVFVEMRDGNTTFGRQIGTYPLLIGFPYPLETNRFVDAKVVGWGYRSITAAEHPLRINSCPLPALEALPAVGRKRAIRLFRRRPIHNSEQLAEALDDRAVARDVEEYVTFD